jgi:hypothetical protein
MTEDAAQTVDVPATSNVVHCESVTEGVRMDRTPKADHVCHDLEIAVGIPIREPEATPRREHEPAVGVLIPQPSEQVLPALDADGHEPLLAALPRHSKHQIIEVDVRPFQSESFIDPQSAIDHEDQQRPRSDLIETFRTVGDQPLEVCVVERLDGLGFGAERLEPESFGQVPLFEQPR